MSTRQSRTRTRQFTDAAQKNAQYHLTLFSNYVRKQSNDRRLKVLGIKERRQRQRQQLRDGILSVAREVARTEGWQGVTIRKIDGSVETDEPVSIV